MQFGVVSALLLESAIVAGPRAGAAAGMGVASVDLAYAAIAVAAGSAARTALAGHEGQLRVVAAALLAVIAVQGLREVARGSSSSRPERASIAGAAGHYIRFVALTAVNPLTIVYFASVAASVSLSGFSSRVAFVTGAGAASAAWHVLLALAGGHGGRRLTPKVQRAVAIGGRLVVLGMAMRFALAI
jgi:threonine/homoserine/homoserine lactone efflux protein